MTLLSRYSELIVLDKIHKLAVNLAANGRDPLLALSESALIIADNSTMERMNELYEWGTGGGRGINMNYARDFDDRDFSPRAAPTPPPLPIKVKPAPVHIPHPPKLEDELKEIVRNLIKNGMTEKQLFDLLNQAIAVNKPKPPTVADFEDHPGFDGAHFEKPEPPTPLDASTSPEEYEDAPGADGAEYERTTYKDTKWYQMMSDYDKEWFDKLPEKRQKEYEDELKSWKPYVPKKESTEFRQQLMAEWCSGWSYLSGIDIKKNKKRNR